jgi:hypothetical protein
MQQQQQTTVSSTIRQDQERIYAMLSHQCHSVNSTVLTLLHSKAAAALQQPTMLHECAWSIACHNTAKSINLYSQLYEAVQACLWHLLC